MIKEKHTLTNPYNRHSLSRYIDVYEVTTDGCSSSPMSGYKGTEATLVDQPAWNEKFSSWSLTGATVTGNNYVINNDVTAKANYETAKNVTLQTDGHGTIASTKMSGFINDNATLSNTASNGYGFSGYSITGATLTGSNFKFTGSNITAKAWFSAVPQYVILYSSNPETAGSAIYHNFTANLITGYPYVAVRMDIKNAAGFTYNYTERVIKGDNATIAGLKAGQGNAMYTPIIGLGTSTPDTALNLSVIGTFGTNPKSYYCNARNADVTAYNTLNYVWGYKSYGLSAALNGIWRYRNPDRLNTFSNVSNFSWTQQTYYGDPPITLYVKNFRVGMFNNISDALSTAW